ncbi:MAG: preprotein translocase subunit YajC [candidate division NC10 bacterium]|nr:preprotein translocase subunit YajC [candidate division NC10 bacterium]
MNLAYAMGPAPSGGGGGAGGLAPFIPIILMFAVFYFLLIHPQRKKQKQHQHMLSELKRGDQIVTAGGIYGTIEGLTDTVVKLKIADNVLIDLSRSAIAAKVGGPEPKG